MRQSTAKYCQALLCGSLICFFSTGLCFAKGPTRDKVSLQLRWMPQFQFAGYYMAEAKGFYRDEGIDIQIIPGNGNRTQIIEEVLSGRADFGIGNSGLALISMQMKPVTVVADIFQRSAAVMIVQPGYENSIRNLSKRNLALRSLQDNPEIYAIFNSLGIKPSDLPVMSTSSNGLEEYINGKADAINAYLSNEPFFLKKRNVPYKIIDPANFGIDFYGDALFARSVYVKNNGDIVKRFVRASIKGWIYALDHTEETVDYLHQGPASYKSKDHLLFEAQIIKELILPDYIPIEQISEVRWEKIATIFKKLGLAPEQSEIQPEFFLSYWENRNAKLTLWSYLGGIIFFVSIVLGIGIWYSKVNMQLSKLLVEKNSLLSSVEELANHDFLTKLPSRRLIYDRIEKGIKTASRNNSKLAVCLLDLNGFKKINDEHGHLVGDQVLIEVAKKLSYWVRESDSIGRIGGDEFLIAIENIQTRENIDAPIARLKEEFELPFLVGQQVFKISFSIGAALFPEDGSTPDELIQVADQNMYQDKRKASHKT